jgi:membrane protease YdiL (CAAX protease family)
MEERNLSKSNLIWKFFGLTLFLSWACWIPAGLLSVERHELFIHILHYAGGLMPTVVTLLMIYFHGNAQERKDYWQRLIDLRRIDKFWYIVILLTVPLLTGIGVVIDLWLGGKGAELGALTNIILKPVSLIPFVIFMLVFGPLPEEMAWRGYALDNLQAKYKAVPASLILGLIWTLWHLPLFWIQGTYQQGLGVGTSQFWLYMLDKIPQSIIIGWIFNNTQRSTASAVLFHFMVNFIGELVDLSLRAEMIYVASWWISALAVIMIWKSQRMQKKKLVN